MFRRVVQGSRSYQQPLALVLAAVLALAACSSDSEGVQLPDGSEAIIVDEVTALSASLSGHWGTGRAVRAVPVGNRTAVVTTTGVYLAEADGAITNLDLFGQTTDVGDVAVSDDGSTLAVATLWPSAVRWYDLDGERFVGLSELAPSTGIAAFGFLGGTTNLVAATSTGVTMWPVGPAGGAATPLGEEVPAGQGTFYEDRLAVPLLNSNEVAIIGPDAVDRLTVDVPAGSALLATRSSPDESTLAVGYGTPDNSDSVAVFETSTFERTGTFATGGALRKDAWAVTDAAVASTDGAIVTMWSHTGESLGAREAPTDQVIQALLPYSEGVVSVHIAGAIADYLDDGTTPTRLLTDGGISLQDAIVDDEFDQLTSVDFYGRISSLDVVTDDDPIHDDRFAAGESTGVTISGDAGSVAVASTNGRVAVLDADLDETSAFAVRGQQPVRIDDVKFNPSTDLLSTGLAERLSALAFDDTVTTWNPGDGNGVFSVGGESEDVPDCGFFYNRVDFTGDGSLMASTSHDFTVALIDGTSGEVAHRFEPFSSTVLDIAFSHDDELLVATADPGTVTVWNVADRSVETEYESPLGGYRALAMLPNTDVMATVDSSGTLRLIEILTGRTMLTFDESSAPSTSIALSPDGSMLAAPDDDAAVSIWSTDSGLRLATLTGHAGSVSDLTFSADGAWLLTSSTDGTARRWELDITT